MLTSLYRAFTRVRDEGGNVIVFFAILLPGVLLLSALALDIGNWYEHRRHLQLQTDAAALAAGQLFRECVDTAGGTVLADMESLGSQYGGDTSAAASPYNEQVGSNGPAAGHVYALDYQSDAYPPGNTPMAQGTDPCVTGILDVRATEDAIPHVFKISPFATVHAHARVEMKAIDQLKGLLPLAVPDVRPQYVFATFINEGTGAPLAGCPSGCTEQLTKGAVVGGNQTWVPIAPLAVPIPTTQTNIGVRIKLVGSNNPAAACGTLYTECYDGLSANGLVYIRDWPNPADPLVPHAQNVFLLPGTCTPDAYFALNDCSAGVQADIDFGDRPLTAAATATVSATTDTGNVSLTRPGGTSGVLTWSTNTGLALTGSGPHVVAMNYTWAMTSGTWHGKTCTNKNNNPCKDSGSFGTNVQRAYLSDPGGSGPIQLAQVYEQGATSSGSNSFHGGTTPNLGVVLRTQGALLLSQPTDAPIYLRVFNDSGSASQNQTVNCDKDLPNVKDEIAQGCSPMFVKNPSLQCPGGSPNNLWDIWYVDGNPLPCALVKTGASVGQISQGFSERIFGTANPKNGSCSQSPVNWIRNVGFDENAHPDDPRAVPLIVTPLGTFNGTGNDQVPVIDFAYFYVTGYKGDPCQGVDPNNDPVANNRGAYVRGHFIKFFPLDKVVVSDDQCDLTSITPCAAVLTR